MEELLKKICDEYEVEEETIEEIIQIEKDNVHKKTRRNIFAQLREVIEKEVGKGDN